MVSVGNSFPGLTAQNASSVIAMRNAWDVRSDLQSETMDEDADASMQRLLAEAYDEFELEEPAEIPGSVFVERCPEEETVTEKTVMEETVEEKISEEESYWESELYHNFRWCIHGIPMPSKHGIQAAHIKQEQQQQHHKEHIKQEQQQQHHKEHQQHQQQYQQQYQQHQQRQQQQEQQQHHKEHQQYQQQQQQQRQQQNHKEWQQYQQQQQEQQQLKGDDPAGGAKGRGQNAPGKGVLGCGREESPGDDGGYEHLHFDNAVEEDA